MLRDWQGFSFVHRLDRSWKGEEPVTRLCAPVMPVPGYLFWKGRRPTTWTKKRRERDRRRGRTTLVFPFLLAFFFLLSLSLPPRLVRGRRHGLADGYDLRHA